MALEQIDYGIENGIPVEVVILDAGFQDEKLTKEIKKRKKHFYHRCKNNYQNKYWASKAYSYR